MTDVSIIIVNYCTGILIKNAINSILQKVNGIVYEIIVVDNKSPDDSMSHIREEFKKVTNIKYVYLEHNLGFGRANNAGYEIATGRNIFCLNPDTILINNAVKILSDFLDTNSNVGVVGGCLYQKDMKMCTSYRRIFPSLFGDFSMMFYYLPEKLFFRKEWKYNEGKVMEVSFITGADLMIKRSVIKAVGFYSPAFFMYYEDVELCHRVKREGYDIFHNPLAKIFHLEGKSTNNIPLKAKINFEGRKAFFALCYPSWYCLLSQFSFVVLSLSRTLILLRRRNESYIYWKELLKLSIKNFGYENSN